MQSFSSEKPLSFDYRRYLDQTDQSSGFWMSLHELISDYPWSSATTRYGAVIHCYCMMGNHLISSSRDRPNSSQAG